NQADSSIPRSISVHSFGSDSSKVSPIRRRHRSSSLASTVSSSSQDETLQGLKNHLFELKLQTLDHQLALLYMEFFSKVEHLQSPIEWIETQTDLPDGSEDSYNLSSPGS